MPFSHRLFNGSIKIDHRDVHAVANQMLFEINLLAGQLLIGVGHLLGEDLLEFAHEESLLLRLDPLLILYVLLARLSQRVRLLLQRADLVLDALGVQIRIELVSPDTFCD